MILKLEKNDEFFMYLFAFHGDIIINFYDI